MEAILLVAAVAALVCGAALLARGGTLAGCLLVLAAGSCLGHPFFNLPGGPIPITLDRLLLLVVIGQYILFRRWGWLEPKPLTKADVALLAFLCVLLASTFAHDWQVRKYQPVSQVLFFYLIPLAMYWIARQTPITARGAGAAFGFLTGFGLYLALTAIAEWRGAYALVVPSYITSPSFAEFYGRARGPCLNPAGLGIFLATCLAASALWLTRFGRTGHLLFVGLAPLTLVATYATLTRSVWMAICGVLAVLGMWLIPRRWWPATIGAAAVAGVLLVAGNWDRVMSFKRDKNLEAGDTEQSVKLRPILATIAWNMFLDRPLLGCGYGHYIDESRPYLSDRTGELPLELARPYVQHNVFLALLTEVGLVGLLCWIAALGYWLRDAWRLLRDQEAPVWARQVAVVFIACFAAYLPNAMFHDASIIPMVNMLLFFLAGMTVSVARGTAQAGAGSWDRIVRWNFEPALDRRVTSH
jgi:O-antigen ligase